MGMFVLMFLQPCLLESRSADARVPNLGGHVLH